MAELFLGETVNASDHKRSGTRIALDPATFTTHGVIVGQTGSGKTGLGIVLIEEALAAGIPTLIIDPKGDLGNLLLMFPDMRAEDFAPWVEGADPATTAQQWKDGLAGWGIDGARVKALKDSSAFTIYTPGSSAGVQLSLTGSLKAPKVAADDSEGRADEVEAVVSGLLGLMGIQSDALSGRENILMTNLIDRAWATGQDLDLGSLVAQVQNPPIRKLGVLDLDTFYPPKDRMELALKLNGLLASPSFATWSEGLPLDIASMLHDANGRPRAAIVSIAHLGDEERQFAVAMLLGKLVTWMRAQPGTSQLRALLYFDEVFGFIPPTAEPPSKKPLLTLLKQARAFGVGVVLATQNPVDVDYKALSNAATWMVGRLQTERDRDRLLDGMKSAAGTTDLDTLAATISGLAKREFVLHRSGTPTPPVFTTRWTMSYLRGPLTREQMSMLMAATPEKAAASVATVGAPAPVAAPVASVAASPTTGPAAQAPPATAATPPSTSVAPAAPAAALADDETPIAPPVAKGTRVFYLDPAASWSDAVGAGASPERLVAGLIARAQLTFDDTKAGVREVSTWEAVATPLDVTFDPAALVTVDFKDEDLRADPLITAPYRIPTAPINDPNWFKAASKAMVDHLVAGTTLDLIRNDALKVWSKPGESEADFTTRCTAAAQAQADVEKKKCEADFAAVQTRLQTAIDTAERALNEKKSIAKSGKMREIIGIATGVLGSLLSNRRSAGSIARSVGTAASRHDAAKGREDRADTAAAAADARRAALDQAVVDHATAVSDIDAKWQAAVTSTTAMPITLERNDVSVQQFALVWIPV